MLERMCMRKVDANYHCEAIYLAFSRREPTRIARSHSFYLTP